MLIRNDGNCLKWLLTNSNMCVIVKNRVFSGGIREMARLNLSERGWVAVGDGLYTRKKANDRSQEGQGAGGGKSWLFFGGLFVCPLRACSTNKPTKQTESWEAAEVLHICVRRRRTMCLALGFRLKAEIWILLPAFRLLSRAAILVLGAFSNVRLSHLSIFLPFFGC